MKSFFLFLSALIFTVPTYGQKVERHNSAQNQIVPVKTALNHLTVMLAKPVLSVASGSDAFRVEWRGERVFIEPTEAGVSTNLFIWTKSGRENYELEPAGSVASMDFAIDTQAFDPPPARKLAAHPKRASDPAEVPIEPMLGGTPVIQENWKAKKDRVQVMVRDLFEQNGDLFIRYSIDNRTTKMYVPGTPNVIEMTRWLSRATLTPRPYTQLSLARRRLTTSTRDRQLYLS
jgi:hypothetical protein